MTRQRRSGLQAPGSRQLPAAPSPEPRAFLGFSLVELIIALAILGVGLVGAIRVFPVGLQASRRSEMSSRAVMTAQQTLESLKLDSCPAEGEQEAAVGPFTVTTRFSHPSSTQLVDAARLTAVEAEVAWAQDGRPKMLTFVTYLRCASSG